MTILKKNKLQPAASFQPIIGAESMTSVKEVAENIGGALLNGPARFVMTRKTALGVQVIKSRAESAAMPVKVASPH
jgi:hypothetical protein